MDICFICKSSEKDDIRYGEFLKNREFGVHTFCLYLSSNLTQNGKDSQGFWGFLVKDIKTEVKRISLLKCCYCYKNYANIGCCEKKCRRTFHLICGIKNKAENRFCHDYGSYCHQHVRKVAERPSATENCLICFDSLCAPGKKSNAIEMIMAPCCRNGWFHKLCLQRFAKTSGYFFKCPLCNDDKVFREKLPAKGIFIPNQDAAWELEPNAFAELLERPNVCAAETCQNRRGRNATNNNNPFVMCHTCGSVAIHKHCLFNQVSYFNCTVCAVALEERDSGIESINSQAHQNDDEYIDVCNVSDKEDMVVVNRLLATSTKMSENKSDLGIENNSDSSDEELRVTIKKYRQLQSNEKEKPASDNDSDAIKPSVSKQTHRLLLESEDTEASQNSSLINVCRRRKGLCILSDSEDEITLPKQKRLNSDKMREEKHKTTLHFPNNKNFTDEISDSSDTDPLEAFIASEQIHNKTTTKTLPQQQQEANNEQSNIRKPQSNGDKKRRKCVALDKNSEHNLNISCIALRTRRQTFAGSSSQKSTENKSKANPLEESCVASRTRRKTICGRTDFNKQTDQFATSLQEFEMSQDYKQLYQSNEALERLTDEDSGSDVKSHLNESRSGSVSLEKDRKFETSCIANRTRRRKTLSSQRLSKILEVSDYSSDYSSSSGMSSILLRNCNRRYKKRRINSDSSLPRSDEAYKQDEESKFKTSCIANRTRKRKTLKGQRSSKIVEVSESTQDSGSSRCYIFQRHDKHKRRIDSSSSEDCDDTTPTVLRKCQLNNFQVDHDDCTKGNDSKFEVSCIANRTRRRKSLKCQRLSKIIEDSECSSDSSSSSRSMFSLTPRKCNNFRRRCNNKRRIDSTSSQEFDKTASCAPKSSAITLETYPLQNFAAVLTHNKKSMSYSSGRFINLSTARHRYRT